MNVVYVPRSEVGYSDQYPRLGAAVYPSERQGWVFHHTVGGAQVSETSTQALSYVRALQTARKADLGADVPYNFVVSLVADDDPYLLVAEGRGLYRSGAHTLDTIDDDDPIRSENRTLVAFGWQGDWRSIDRLADYGDPDEILDNAVRSLGVWVYGHLTPELPPLQGTFPHSMFKQTTCPGDPLRVRLDMFNTIATEGNLLASIDQAIVDELGKLEPDDVVWLVGFVNEMRNRFGATATSLGYPLLLLREIADQFGIAANRPDEIVDELVRRLEDDGTDDSDTLRKVVAAFAAAKSTLEKK